MKSLPESQDGFPEPTKSNLSWLTELPLVKLLIGMLKHFVEELGAVIGFTRRFFAWTVRPPFRWQELLNQLELIGIRSIPIIALTGLFSGAVLGLQTGYAFRLFNAENLVGSTIGLSLTRELAPVFTALMITARCGSAMAAEIGSMRVTEQIDALKTMAVNPIQFLVVPRVLATTIMAPLLCALFSYIGVVGGYFVAIKILSIHSFYFIDNLVYHVDPEDIIGGLIKATVFGFLLAVVSCYQGYATRGGSKGVGIATTRSVVISSVLILIVDYFLTAWILEFFLND